MDFTYDNFNSLNLIFENFLNISVLSENINTCSINENVDLVANMMNDKDFDIYGVADENGVIIGYIENNSLSTGTVKDHYVEFSTDELLSDSTSLIKLIEVFKENNKKRMFILEHNKITRIVTVADLHKQPMRMLIFSYISLLEMQITSKIKEMYPENKWKKYLSKDRLETAQTLYNERYKKNEALELIDSTQLCDKGTILRKSDELFSELQFVSKKEFKGFFKKLENLRNHTAHSQESLYEDSNELIDLILKVKDMCHILQ